MTVLREDEAGVTGRDGSRTGSVWIAEGQSSPYSHLESTPAEEAGLLDSSRWKSGRTRKKTTFAHFCDFAHRPPANGQEFHFRASSRLSGQPGFLPQPVIPLQDQLGPPSYSGLFWRFWTKVTKVVIYREKTEFSTFGCFLSLLRFT